MPSPRPLPPIPPRRRPPPGLQGLPPHATEHRRTQRTRVRTRRRRLGALIAVALVSLVAGLASAADGDDAGTHRSAGNAASPARRAGNDRHGFGRAAAIGPVTGPGYLAPGSDPGVLPGNLLIADRANDRLLVLTPRGQIAWQFPRPGDLRPGESFKVPDDAFYSPDGRQIVATEEDDFAVSVIDVASHRLVYRYGTPGVSGAEANHLFNPDDAMLTRAGDLFSADIKNCRLIVVHPPAHQVAHQLGQTGSCQHDPPLSYASPNGAFPRQQGGFVITEINGDWVDLLDGAGHVQATAHPPGFSYPSDSNEVSPGQLLSVDYVNPGAVETFTPTGSLLWRYAPLRPGDALNKPSLALPLPNGDVLLNDDYNHRVIVIDPHTNRIVWQYGHTGQPGRRPGYLNTPDGVDLASPHSVADRFPAMTAPR